VGCRGRITPIYCIDPSIERPQKSQATSHTGKGIGDSQGCYKPENQRLCGVGPAGDPVPGSPLAKWESKYGKIRTTIKKTRELIHGGSTSIMAVVERLPDPNTLSKEKKRIRCSSIRYKVCPTNC
jgi:hypothetical protein